MTGMQLVQGCYAEAWVGVEPQTFELQGRTLSTEPQNPVETHHIIAHLSFGFSLTKIALLGARWGDAMRRKKDVARLTE